MSELRRVHSVHKHERHTGRIGEWNLGEKLIQSLILGKKRAYWGVKADGGMEEPRLLVFHLSLRQRDEIFHLHFRGETGVGQGSVF